MSYPSNFEMSTVSKVHLPIRDFKRKLDRQSINQSPRCDSASEKRFKSSHNGDSSKSSSSDALDDMIVPEVQIGSESTPPLVTALREPRHGSLVISHVQPTKLVYPKSLFINHEPPLPVTSEGQAIRTLLNICSRSEGSMDQPEYTTFELRQFSIYRDISGQEGTPWNAVLSDHEFISLHFLKGKLGLNKLFFDGVLEAGTTSVYVERVPFETVAVEGYDDEDVHTVADRICIQSLAGRKHAVWYRLSQPSSEYARYHSAFLWIADFAKHTVDYFINHENVVISDFKCNFYRWIRERYGSSPAFARWLAQHRKQDFRSTVHAYVSYLWKECVDVAPETRKHPIWDEIDPCNLAAVQEHPSAYPDRTIVTPFVKECFKNMYFSDILEPLRPTDPDVLASHKRKRVSLGFDQNLWDFEPNKYSTPNMMINSPNKKEVEICKGDVVGILRDQRSVWKDKENIWYAYVQAIERTSRGKTSLRLIWLYRPSDTTLSASYYPLKDELFFSDHCNCPDERVRLSDVVGKLRTTWFAHEREEGSDCFVRQKYCTVDQSFSTLRKSDFLCDCLRNEDPMDSSPTLEFRAGDSVLVHLPSETQNEDLLEPVVITNSPGDGTFVVRRLPRRSRLCNVSAGMEAVQSNNLERTCAQIKPNELLWSDEFFPISISKIERRCLVRFYTEKEVLSGLPTPYDRDGAVDCFFVTSYLKSADQRQWIEALDELSFKALQLNQGFDPHQKIERAQLRGLDLFCGGGNFGRGLEEGGAVKQIYAVDLWTNAIHTYKANLPNANHTHLYRGSVDDFLAQAITGSAEGRPGPEDIDHVSAGSPCQGMSNLQPDKYSQRSKLNTSKVASVAAYIEMYRPQYALFENVIPLTASIGPKKDQNVFSQLLCALVGIGYQVQQFNLDAWSFGSSQSRSRVFIAIAAPGLKPIPHPIPTHSHPKTVKSRALGRAVNGQPFGERRFNTPVFHYRTAKDAVQDLPDIADGHVETCIQFPDHRMTRRLRPLLRSMVTNMIPTLPRRMGIYAAAEAGLLAQPQRDDWLTHSKARRGPSSKSWMRNDPEKLFPTITTTLLPADAMGGKALHWDQDRLLTVMEARRAQGFPDEEVIIGLPAVQWKVIGNSVDRKVALALGMSLREAWLAGKQGAEEKRHVAARDAVELAKGMAASTYNTVSHRFLESPNQPADLLKSIQTLIDPTTECDEM